MNLPARQVSTIITATAVLVVISVFLAACDQVASEASLGSKGLAAPAASGTGNDTAAGAVDKHCGSEGRCSLENNSDQSGNQRPLLGENFSSNKKRAQPSRENVRGKDTKLEKGELALSIPRLGLRDVPVPVGSTQADLDREGIIRLAQSGAPWHEGSNTFIVGHRLGYLHTKITYVFYKLDKMKPGDEILVEDAAGRKYTYEVYDYMTVRPVDRWVMYPVDGMTTISLVTCTPIPTFENRFVVRGELVRLSS